MAKVGATIRWKTRDETASLAARMFLSIGRTGAWGVTLGAVLGAALGCRSVPPRVDPTAGGWSLARGQALWCRTATAPALAGEVLLARHPDGSAWLEFSKVPLTLVTAQRTTTRWWLTLGPRGSNYSGRGVPPTRSAWLLLLAWAPDAPPPRGWNIRPLESGGWRFEQAATGETLELVDLQPPETWTPPRGIAPSSRRSHIHEPEAEPAGADGRR